MGMEQPPQQIPDDNELPLRISHAEKVESAGREAEIYEVEISKSGKEGEPKPFVLKEVKQKGFEQIEETIEEAAESKKFYDFLKSSPEFAPFVPETFYFIARKTKDDEPHSYRLQPHIEGRTLDEIPDEELYADKKLDQDLIRCIDGLVDIFKRQQKEGGDLPDLYGRKVLPNMAYNPRYTTNLMVADKPNKEGQRLFFVDTSKQSQAKSSEAVDWWHKNVGAPAQMFYLERWKKTIEGKLAPKRKPVPHAEPALG